MSPAYTTIKKDLALFSERLGKTHNFREPGTPGPGGSLIRIGEIKLNSVNSGDQGIQDEKRLWPMFVSASVLSLMGLCVALFARCSRVYWSTTDARKRCVYTCKIVECRPPGVEPDINSTVEHDENRTVAHSPTSFAGEPLIRVVLELDSGQCCDSR